MGVLNYSEKILKRWDERLYSWAKYCAARHAFYEFITFGVKQAWACLFGALLLLLIIATHFLYPSDALITRYDFLVIGAIAIQAFMLAYKLETWEEARIIFIFHVVGTVMELFKTAVGSWIYPEMSILRIGGVPLFTGFMYAAVGSYIARCSRLFDFRFTHHPSSTALGLVSLLIYINFFTHHYTYDIRYLLIACIVIMCRRTRIYFKVRDVHRSMPLLLGFVLVATFIWLAENIGTFTAVWIYPNQTMGWQMVSPEKLGSWFLLMIISYTLVYMQIKDRK